MPAAKTFTQLLAELGAHGAGPRRAARAHEVSTLIASLLASCRTVAVEARANGVAFRLRGATESAKEFSLTCVLHHPAGTGPLTTAEQAVADRLCEGRTLAQIAHLRGVSSNTIKSQVRQIFRKLNVNSRVELVRKMVT
ncbi:MAG TPA: LuxR C-terminal-related transcriptional regulator [Steroidobacteraceae bacterium]|nr:LuxR C-terminal-related transcriptional regulator [Steroidobacteraceae bacterium]